MAIKSLGYIGINSTDLHQWREYGCQVMGLEDASERNGASDSSLYLKMDEHPYRITVQLADSDSFGFCGWETNNQQGFDEAVSSLNNAGIEVQMGSSELAAARKVQWPACSRHWIQMRQAGSRSMRCFRLRQRVQLGLNLTTTAMGT